MKILKLDQNQTGKKSFKRLRQQTTQTKLKSIQRTNTLQC